MCDVRTGEFMTIQQIDEIGMCMHDTQRCNIHSIIEAGVWASIEDDTKLTGMEAKLASQQRPAIG